MLYMYSLSPENSPAFSGETGLFVFSKNLRQYRWYSSHRDGPRPFTEPVHAHLKYDNPAGLLSHLLNLRKALLVLEILGFLSVHLKGKYIDAFFLFFFCSGCSKWLFNFKLDEDFCILHRFQTNDYRAPVILVH